jgi:hypothetical protein
MVYRATPHNTTGYSPFYLLPGREMVLPNEGDIKPKFLLDIQDADQVHTWENLKSSFMKAHNEVRLNNRFVHQKNKAYYDKKAKERKFEIDKVYLFCRAWNPGRCNKFRSFWQGPFIVQKLSDLNYKIVDKKWKEFVVNINRLKKSYDQTPRSFENARRPRQKPRQPDTETLDEDVVIQSRPIATGDEREPQVVKTPALKEEHLQLDQDTQVPGNVETPDADSKRRKQTPDSSVQNPDYEPPNSPRSRRASNNTHNTARDKSRARLQLQENPPV